MLLSIMLIPCECVNNGSKKEQAKRFLTDIPPDTVFFSNVHKITRNVRTILAIMYRGAIHKLRYAEREKEVISCVTVLSKCMGKRRNPRNKGGGKNHVRNVICGWR